ncbi:MAG TPA: hypothetical protein VH877_27840 [Polyangia bacterium]|jgi:hypothetical protein|nr:hypothetical protein [Polyangia bacterium]
MEVSLIDRDTLETTIGLDDMVVRNLQITEGYHELELALTSLFGSTDVRWCAFATWASKTAGRFIRGEEHPDIIRHFLAEAYPEMVHLGSMNEQLAQMPGMTPLGNSFIYETLERITNGVSAAVAAGNLKVFRELGPLFADFIQRFRASTVFDQRELDRFLATLVPGPTEEGGQGLLIRAFTHYYQARFTAEAKPRAELLLLANDLIGLHEQTRLQPEIESALEAPIALLLMEVAKLHARHTIPSPLHRAVDAVIQTVIHPLIAPLQSIWRRVATEWLTRLELPEGTLRLGETLPPLPSGGMFPATLRTIENAELRDLLTLLDRTPDRLAGSAARDWGDLGDRMNLIVDLFRSRQQDECLHRPPFTAEQVQLIRAGERPSGPL